MCMRMHDTYALELYTCSYVNLSVYVCWVGNGSEVGGQR